MEDCGPLYLPASLHGGSETLASSPVNDSFNQTPPPEFLKETISSIAYRTKPSPLLEAEHIADCHEIMGCRGASRCRSILRGPDLQLCIHGKEAEDAGTFPSPSDNYSDGVSKLLVDSAPGVGGE